MWSGKEAWNVFEHGAPCPPIVVSFKLAASKPAQAGHFGGTLQFY
jgi:hypothetical protein